MLEQNDAGWARGSKEEGRTRPLSRVIYCIVNNLVFLVSLVSLGKGLVLKGRKKKEKFSG